MAIEITEFTAPRQRYGSMVSAAPVPYLAHSKVAATSATNLNVKTALLAILPDVDVRFVVTREASVNADANSAILKAGVLRWFDVEAGSGWALKLVAA